MRIAIVNDLELAVTAIRRVLEHDGRHSVAWVAHDGRQALQHCARDRPDLILLDLVMPGLDGVETTQRVMARHPCPILIVTASVDGRAGLVFEAMGHGALAAVRVPSLRLPPAEGGRELLARISSLERLQGASRRSAPAVNTATPLIAIGASTGGPAALARLLGSLPTDLPAAIVIVQHIDARFASGLVHWLDGQVPLPVAAAIPGTAPRAGQISIAQTDDHLTIDRRGRFAHTSEPQREPYRPSVNVFFDSLRRHWRSPGQAVLLTGMGRDGAEGLLSLRQAGWRTIAQDAGSSAVYGMPRAAAELGAAAEILALEAIAGRLLAGLPQA